MEKKTTKREYFQAIKVAVGEMDKVGELFVEDVVAFLDKQIQQIDAKAERVKAKSAEKKAEGDQLREVVKSVLTDEFQSAEEILAQIEGSDVTRAKVVARLTQLVKLGEAEKEPGKFDGRRIMTYRRMA